MYIYTYRNIFSWAIFISYVNCMKITLKTGFKAYCFWCTAPGLHNLRMIHISTCWTSIVTCNFFGFYNSWAVWMHVFISAFIDSKDSVHHFSFILKTISLFFVFFIHLFIEFCNSYSPSLPCLIFPSVFPFSQID